MALVQLGPISLGGRPSVVGVVDAFYEVDYFLALADQGVEILEFRLDLFDSSFLVEVITYFKKIAALGRFGLLGTVREAPKNRLIRAGLYEELLSIVHMIDIDYDSSDRFRLIALARDKKKLILLSDHEYDSMPSDEVIRLRYEDMVLMGADGVKFAYMATSKEDVLRLLSLCSHYSDLPEAPFVSVMAMGELGKPSRVVAGAFGSALTYGFLGETSVAPGQWPATDLARLIRGLYSN